MTIEEIQTQIGGIRAVQDDCESAHFKDDALREDFIRYVSTLEIPTLAEKAKLVLSTNDIVFDRWYA